RHDADFAGSGTGGPCRHVLCRARCLDDRGRIMRALSFDLRHRFNLRYLGAAAGLLLVALSAGAMWRFGAWMPKFGQTALDAGYRMSATAGFDLTSVQLIGRRHADKTEILDAIGIARGGPILAIDPQSLRARLEAIDWIDQAQVRRVLPN